MSSANGVIIVLSRQVPRGEAVRASYVKPSANPLQNSAGNQVESFSGQPS